MLYQGLTACNNGENKLLDARIEPPGDAYNLPNFGDQCISSNSTAALDGLEPKFSHVQLHRFKVENSFAIAHKLINKITNDYGIYGPIDLIKCEVLTNNKIPNKYYQ